MREIALAFFLCLIVALAVLVALQHRDTSLPIVNAAVPLVPDRRVSPTMCMVPPAPVPQSERNA
jgi:hypothetical protein